MEKCRWGKVEQVPMECPICNREWEALCYVGTEELECPSCGFMVVRDDHEILE